MLSKVLLCINGIGKFFDKVWCMYCNGPLGRNNKPCLGGNGLKAHIFTDIIGWSDFMTKKHSIEGNDAYHV